MHKLICFWLIERFLWGEEKKEVASAKILAAAVTVPAVLSELKIISCLCGVFFFLTVLQAEVNHRPWNRLAVPLSTPCEHSLSDYGQHHAIVLSQTGSVVQFWSWSNCLQPARFQMDVPIQCDQQLWTIKCLEGSRSKINTVFKPTCLFRQLWTLFHLAKNTLFRWETFTLQRQNLSHIPPRVH